MEEKKQNLEFIAPEVKIVTITPRSRILEGSGEAPQSTTFDNMTVNPYSEGGTI